MNLFDADTKALYAREIDAEKRTSLSTLLKLVPAGIEVLDVGLGGGALGQRLARERGCQVDGVTLSEEEAANAAPHYRRIEVADLNTVSLTALFGTRRYGAIVCADVLEHINRPTAVLDACRDLLAHDGVLLLSIPNVAYIGLIGELLSGEFRYRIEGLLDRTHVRFFTRRSLLRMLRDKGWDVDLVEPIKLDLPESEFNVGFDDLPPAVQRYLLAMPDGLTYQFVVRAHPRPAGSLADEVAPSGSEFSAESPAPDAPHFSALLYLKDESGYAEDRKVVAHGRIGDARQLLRFSLPAQARPLVGLRFDPADRPGFLHLYGLRLCSITGEIAWSWDGKSETLASGTHQQVIFRLPWFEHEGAIILLSGEDPFFELPLGREQLEQCQLGGVVEVDMGWPMSADYALFVDELAARQAKVESLQRDLAQAQIDFERHLAQAQIDAQRLAETQGHAQQLEEKLAAESEELHRMKDEVDQLLVEKEDIRAQSGQLSVAAQLSRAEVEFVKKRVEQQRLQSHAVARERDALRERLDRLERSLLFRVSSRFSGTLRGSVSQRLPGTPRTASTGNLQLHSPPPVAEGVDVIVPVYKGLQETKTCLESVLRSTPTMPFRVVVINDASPEPEITAYLRDLRDLDARVELIENQTNAGFVVSVNRGMQQSRRHDVVLLNSDTEVAGDWLDRLHLAAYRESHIGTVTPFSNSATICSYPKFCVDNPLPGGTTTAELDRFFATENAGQTVDIPTAVGFCMFIRRDCLNAVGLFDVERFGRGYGEENDFCMRARKAGWRHVQALDTFVLHAGGVSFGAERAHRVEDAQNTLRRLHPDYEQLVQHHLAADPARSARLAVDLARIRESGLRALLFVSHFGGGGTERHVRELAALLERHANIFLLRPTEGGETLLEWLRPGEGFRLAFRLDDELEALATALKSLNICHVHYHHLLGHAPSIWGLPDLLGVAHDFTVHDFYSVCPQISLTNQTDRYCGEKGVAQCADCLRNSPPPGRVSIETWRAGYRSLVEGARNVFTPSVETAKRIQRYFPAARVLQVPHIDMSAHQPVAAPAPMTEDRPLRIAVVGALSKIKGADVLEAAAVESARRGVPLEFHLLGFAYRTLLTQPKARLTVHGAYEEQDLPELLAWLKPDLAWFPALWPETYSYTLSACLNARLPIVAPDFGAFPERLHGRAWTWLCPWNRPAPQWVQFFERVRREHFLVGTGPAPAEGLAVSPSKFSYGIDYLPEVVAPLDPPQLSRELLEQLRPGRTFTGRGRRAKRTMLSLAIRVRRTPILGAVARQMPRHWQLRARAWLKS